MRLHVQLLGTKWHTVWWLPWLLVPQTLCAELFSCVCTSKLKVRSCVCACSCMVINIYCEKNRHSVHHSTVDFIPSLPYISTLIPPPPAPWYCRFTPPLSYYSHPFINLPSPCLAHTPHSGLYQNPDSRVCEPCDAQCVEGCSAGTVRLRHQLNFTQYGWQWI